jgi:Ca2+/Na+ antiporter
METIIIYKTLGTIGLIFIIAGMMVRSRTRRDALCAVGGICLFVYSIYLNDFIFTTLQACYVFVTLFDFAKRKLQKK